MLKLDKLISGDMGLAASVIKTANSPFYGLNHKVQAVKSALQVLGIRSVTNIVTLLAMRNALGAPGKPNDPFWDQFWDRTNYHAIACARLAKQPAFHLCRRRLHLRPVQRLRHSHPRPAL